jgi:hypothetical protein
MVIIDGRVTLGSADGLSGGRVLLEAINDLFHTRSQPRAYPY